MIRGAFQVGLVALSLSAAFAACSGDEGSSSPSTTPDGGAVTSTTIGASGGTVSAGGASIVIPAGALSSDVTITLSVESGAPSGTGLEAATILTNVYVAKPHGTTFAKPVTVELPVIAEPGASPEIWTLADDSDTSWEKLASATVSGSKLRFETTHFSKMVGVRFGGGTSQDGGGDGGGSVDGGTTTPVCYDYAPLGSELTAPIMLAGGVLYVSPNAGPGAGKVHTIKAATFADYLAYPDMNGARSFASNVNGVFWANTSGVNAAGLYRLSTGAPAKQADLVGVPGQMGATDANVFYATVNGFNYSLMRGDGNGQNPVILAGNVYADQLMVSGGYVYWVDTSAAAASTYCATPGNKMPQISRVAVGASAPSVAEIAVDGCAIVAASGRASEKLTRFTTDGAFTYAQSDLGEVWKTPVAGGAPSRIFQPSFPKAQSGAALAIVGSNLVFNDQDTSVGANPGFKKMPLAGGPAVRFAQNYAKFALASDASNVYFATERQICRLPVP